MQEPLGSLDVPPSGLKQSSDTTAGEPPVQVMVMVRAVVSPTTVATVVPAPFFKVELVTPFEYRPVVLRHTVEPFFMVMVVVMAGG